MPLAAGQRLLIEDLQAIAALALVEKVLGSDETRTSTTTFSDSALFVTLEASKTYDIDVWLALLGAQAGDAKFQYTFPANATVQVWQFAPSTGLTGAADEGDTNYGARAIDATSPTSPTFCGVLDTTNPVSLHHRLRVVMGVTAGDVRLQWAQNASNATATTIKAGGKMRAQLTSANG